jgi:hypothetical protein
LNHGGQGCGLPFNRQFDGVVRHQWGARRWQGPKKSKNDGNVKYSGENEGRDGHSRVLDSSIWRRTIHRPPEIVPLTIDPSIASERYRSRFIAFETCAGVDNDKR